MAELYVSLEAGDIRLEPLAEDHREGLRAACAADADIWPIYPVNYLGDGFDPNFNLMLNGPPQRCCYAIHNKGEMIGMTAWIDDNIILSSVEIGNTYIIPALRGTGFNDALKKLMMTHVFANGYRRLVFKVDERNKRSQGAVLKLGCTQEGILRAERITWTGHVRNTVIFSILADEWAAKQGNKLS